MQILESKEKKEIKYWLEIRDAKRKFIEYKFYYPKKKNIIQIIKDERNGKKRYE